MGRPLSENGTFALVGLSRSGTISGISKFGKTWIVALVLLCGLAAGALVALASGGGQGDQRPRLFGLEARLDNSGADVVASGKVRGAGNVLVRYGKNCRLRRLSHAARADGGSFRLQ